MSEVLKVVRLDGALFYNAEFSSPWSFRSPPSRTISSYLQPGSGHVIIYHLLTEGRAHARLEEGKSIALEAGDVVIFPHGDAHILENGSGAETVDYGKELLRIFSHGLKAAYHGGGGEITKFVCGYMVCEPRLSQVFLSGLPRLFKVSIRDDQAGGWLENSIRFSVTEANAARAGSEAVLSKLSEVLFVETLRRYIARLPEDQSGWLAGARDPEVAKALALMHRQPAHPWTLADLAKEVGTSRSVVAERFRRYLGQPPMTYLTQWRLQLAAQMLTSTSHSAAQVASEVGYESEAAFNRAFKRDFGLPPARFRSRSKAQAATPTPQIVRKGRPTG
ncbi:AraC-like DNA-binding protein [Silvibacterium bohemicum]|uniref:AraC-like DNA-binding protein n=1 Tax=Silvibacterium bohemicum TaxID=1577686 RepID=A0A841JWP2_9BACT|nr:AraC family transcriptional regulator [Silvibacterium bohemicum]MBB6145570.1 AraC-like DNA-binding protein [Silvibacterium bohemicum]